MSPDRCCRYSRKGPALYVLGSFQSNLSLSLKTEMPKESLKKSKHRMLILEVILQTAVSLFSHVILHTDLCLLLLILTYSQIILNIHTLGEAFLS